LVQTKFFSPQSSFILVASIHPHTSLRHDAAILFSFIIAFQNFSQV